MNFRLAGMPRLLKDIIGLVPQEERGGLRRVVSLLFLMAILDTVGVAAIMPFVAIVGDQSLIFDSRLLSYLYSVLEFSSQRTFVFFVGAAVFSFFIFSMMVKVIAIRQQLSFSMRQEAVLGKKLMAKYLAQDYEWLANRNSSELSQVIFTEVHQFIFQGLAPLLLTAAQLLLVACIVSLLVAVDVDLAVSILTFLVIAYGSLLAFVRAKIDTIADERFLANQKRFKVVNETFGSPKVLKIMGLDRFFFSRFSEPAEVHALRQGQGQVLTQIPRFFLEGIIFGSFILYILFQFSLGTNLSDVLPTLTLFALAGFRLMPAMQQIYTGVSNMRLAGPAIERISKDLALPSADADLHAESKPSGDVSCERDWSSGHIQLRGVEFSYGPAFPKVVNGLNLEIRKGQHIALIGATGCGKTTVVDLLCGLLTPDAGAFTINGLALQDSDYRAWQSNIGYVTQHSFLIDDTIKANVAFGVPEKLVDIERVKSCLRAAQLNDFAEVGEQGLSLMVGERGALLSGGQMQRVGIARALYRNPALLVLDEATSALDAVTEEKLVSSLVSWRSDLTIISIAHRISTIEQCDQIFIVEDGMITEFGTASQLRNTSAYFRSVNGLDSSEKVEK